MSNQFADIAFTPSVRAVQSALGSRDHYARMEGGVAHNRKLGPDAVNFIGLRDTFYIASVSETGWPYVQHRGGPPGFLKVIDPTTIGFADYRGNRQYVSVGNLSKDDRVALILVDYPQRTRLKILGHARVVPEEESALYGQWKTPGFRARVERAFAITVAAFDWNCPQHITPRYTTEEIQSMIEPLRARVSELEAQLQSCRDGSTPDK